MTMDVLNVLTISKVVAAVVALAVVWLVFKIVEHFVYLQKLRAKTTLPGPFRDGSEPWSFNVFPVPSKQGHPFTETLKTAHKYGDMYMTTFPIPLVFVSGVEATREVLSTQNLPKAFGGILETFTGRMLQSRDHFYPHGDWKLYRKLMDKPFRKSSIKALTPLFEKHSLRLVQQMQKTIAENGQGQEATVSISEYLTKATMDVICDSAFGYQLGALYNQNLEISAAFDRVIEGVTSPLNTGLPLLTDFARWSARDSTTIVNKVLSDAIDKRMEYVRTHPNEEYVILLDLMITSETEGKTLSRQELLAELFLFFLAGHETTTSTLSWVINYLTVYPDVMKRVREEIERVLDGKDEISYEDQESMIYTTQVIKEVLRLNPIVPFLPRQVPSEGDTYVGGHLLPKGALIFFSPFLVHHNPNVWEDPERFDPDRFAPGKNEHMPAHAYIPFSAGSRICIGMQFFWCEARIILAHCLRHFDFELPADRAADPLKAKYNTVLRLADTRLIVKPRKIQL